MYIVRGKKMHVEIFGEKSSPAVLFLHGGPGESCYEFVYHQADRLSEHVQLIAIDQRGVCRSEMVQPKEDFRLDDLIEDFEALRLQLNIDHWSVIGHSFGGYLALIYASRYPKSVSRLVFECPTFNFGWTSRSLLKKASSVFLSVGDVQNSNECMKLSEALLTNKELFEHYIRLGEALGEKKSVIYNPTPMSWTDYSSYSDEEWDEYGSRTEIHLERLQKEGSMFESIVPLLPDISVPSMLILGEHDPVTCPRHIQAYNQTDGESIIFEGCGHTPHAEQPDRYRDVIISFLLPGINP